MTMITMSKLMPWDDIPTPKADLHVKLVADTGPVKAYWGKDISDKRLLILELEGDNVDTFRKGRTQVQGISVDLLQTEPHRQQSLVFRLEHTNDQDLFLSFCAALIEVLRQSTDRSAAVHISLAHLRRWKAFLSSGRTQGLSPEEVRGLFGELEFLELLMAKLPPLAAIEAWCGPLGGQQDFIFGQRALEVKTLFGPNRRTVRISSEDQLDGVERTLLLAVFRITEATDQSEALSLNAKVNQIADALADVGAEEKLWKRLGSVGYIAVADYDAPAYMITSRQYYLVNPDFPRLIRPSIPYGIVRVSYDIQLETIATFEVDQETLWSIP